MKQYSPHHTGSGVTDHSESVIHPDRRVRRLLTIANIPSVFKLPGGELADVSSTDDGSPQHAASSAHGGQNTEGLLQAPYLSLRSLVSSFWVCSSSWRSLMWASWMSWISAFTACSLANSWRRRVFPYSEDFLQYHALEFALNIWQILWALNYSNRKKTKQKVYVAWYHRMEIVPDPITCRYIELLNMQATCFSK